MIKNYKELPRGWKEFEVNGEIYYLKLKGTEITYSWTKKNGKLQRINISTLTNKSLINAFECVRSLELNN